MTFRKRNLAKLVSPFETVTQKATGCRKNCMMAIDVGKRQLVREK